MSRILADIIKKSDYKLTQFDDSAVDAIEQNIVKKNDKVQYIKCLVSNQIKVFWHKHISCPGNKLEDIGRATDATMHLWRMWLECI